MYQKLFSIVVWIGIYLIELIEAKLTRELIKEIKELARKEAELTRELIKEVAKYLGDLDLMVTVKKYKERNNSSLALFK